jgi:hypothetical protein
MNDTSGKDEGRESLNDSFARRLKRFTPDRGGLDREALLFAAGRASARPNRGWMALAGTLAACQLVSLGLLWSRTSGPTHGPSRASPTSVAETPFDERPHDPEAASPNELWVLRARMVSGGGDLRAPTIKGPLVPDEPPLRAFPLPASKILN